MLAWVFGSDSKGVLRGVINGLTGIRNVGLTLMLQPQHAGTLGADGWTKKEIARFISEYARVPAYRHLNYWHPQLLGGERRPIDPDASVAVLDSPDIVRLLVAGGAGGLFVSLLTGGKSWVTKKVELPANWGKLVEKYKDVIPTYSEAI